ncbi:hypothetical protein FRC04_004618 [Tulasnella sp. 424]|nr:hypothetical protein FRC04_004618 [Tulasnella sp. 424]
MRYCVLGFRRRIRPYSTIAAYIAIQTAETTSNAGLASISPKPSNHGSSFTSLETGKQRIGSTSETSTLILDGGVHPEEEAYIQKKKLPSSSPPGSSSSTATTAQESVSDSGNDDLSSTTLSATVPARTTSTTGNPSDEPRPSQS